MGDINQATALDDIINEIRKNFKLVLLPGTAPEKITVVLNYPSARVEHSFEVEKK